MILWSFSSISRNIVAAGMKMEATTCMVRFRSPSVAWGIRMIKAVPRNPDK